MTTEPNRTEPKSAGCLLCLRYFKNEHGVSIHVGKIHNKPIYREGAKDAKEGLTAEVESNAG